MKHCGVSDDSLQEITSVQGCLYLGQLEIDVSLGLHVGLSVLCHLGHVEFPWSKEASLDQCVYHGASVDVIGLLLGEQPLAIRAL